LGGVFGRVDECEGAAVVSVEYFLLLDLMIGIVERGRE
jgi:hypothetical protein